MEVLMLQLKLQYFGHLMRKADSFEKILMLGKIEGRRRVNDNFTQPIGSIMHSTAESRVTLTYLKGQINLTKVIYWVISPTFPCSFSLRFTFHSIRGKKMQYYKVVTALKMTEINNLTFIMTALLWFSSVLWSPLSCSTHRGLAVLGDRTF